MTNTQPKNLWSEIKYWIFILLVLGVLFEMVASMILYRKYATGKYAIFYFTENIFKKSAGEKTYRLHEASRPDSSSAINKLIADETVRSNQFNYEPWMMFRLADFHSNYVNIKGFERRSVPNAFIKPGSTDTIDIYFFGGNTMYGYNIADAETIPSQFLKTLQQENPTVSVRVKNYGVPHYYSKQELILLTSLLFEGHRPDIVIFLDGLNDFYPSRMLYYDRPYFSYALQQSFEGKMFQKGKQEFLDSTVQFINDPPGISGKEYNDALISKYTNNIHMATALCNKAGAKSYFFCQPVPFYKYPQQDNATRYSYIYPELEKNEDSLNNFYFLGNMLENEKQNAFVDSLNYSPQLAGRIARQILTTVKKDLQ